MEAASTMKQMPASGLNFLRGPEGRLRAGWRILLFLALTVGLSAPSMMAARWLFGSLPSSLAPLVIAPVATLTVFICRRYLDRRPFSSLGLRLGRAAVMDAAFGFVLSGLMVAGLCAALMAGGWLQVESTAAWPAALPALLMGLATTGVVVAYWEELFMRGYLLQNMADGLGLKTAVVISMVVYGLLHSLNPGASLLSGSLIALIGFVRAYGWISTRQLWLSMGMHAGWNFFQGPVFGFGVSGVRSNSWLHHQVNGPAWLTGGAFGPEAGLICLPFMALGLLAMFFWSRGRA